MRTKQTLMLFSLIFILALPGWSGGNPGDTGLLLEKAKREGRIVMLELGSVGCAPCEQMKPVMEKLKKNYGDKLEVIFVDVRKDRENARRFGAGMIPTQVFLDRKGREFHRHIGYFAYEDILPVLKKAGI